MLFRSGLTGEAPVRAAPAPKKVVEEDDDVPFTNSKPVSTPAPSSVDEDEDEDLAMFRKLAED